MENYKVIIKPIKPKVVETDPIKIAERKEKRMLRLEALKNTPRTPKEPKAKVDHSNEINKINEKVKSLIGFSVDEINDKLKSNEPQAPPQPKPPKQISKRQPKAKA